ncbi:MAG: amidase [Bradyrhizobium sp.]
MSISNPTTNDLCSLSASELASGYARRTFSPVEVLDAVFDRVERLNPQLNAFFYLDREGARAAAHASADRWTRGESLGALDGVPVSVKDSVAVAGMPMYRGAAPFRNRKPSTSNSPPAARLFEAGAIVFGKTTMPDLGLLASGVSSAHGITRNPWNLNMNTGGSSSGGAAAVAARLGPLTIGSDLGGSVRLPAAFCGLATLKPTQGRIPHLPPSTMRSAGPIARTVEDVALLMDVLARYDARDCGALGPEDGSYMSARVDDVRGWRVGLLENIGFGPNAHPEIHEAVRRAAECMARAGASVEPAGPLVDSDPGDAFDRIFSARGHHEIARLSDAERNALHPAVLQLAMRAVSMPAESYLAAQDEIEGFKMQVAERTDAFDVVLMPATPVISYPADAAAPDLDDVHQSIVPYTAMFNQTGQPAAVICGGFSQNGLPIGVQIVGRRHQDRRVLSAAAFLENALGVVRNWPF